jgi:hypothetical protein
VQSEFYLMPKPAADGTRSLGWERLLTRAPDHVVFNGRANQYASHPIEVQPNELLRLYVVNAGPKRISSFHVVGGIFERVFQDGSKMSPLAGVQTVNIPVGGGSIFELRLRSQGITPLSPGSLPLRPVWAPRDSPAHSPWLRVFPPQAT